MERVIPPPAPPRPRHRVLIAVALAWGLVLVTTGIWYSFHGRPTAREQTTVAQAQPVVDRAAGAVVHAAGTAAVPAVFGFDKVSDCDVTPLRGGVKYERAVWLYTTAGGEPDLLQRIADALPGRYKAQVHHPADGGLPTLTADAGFFVTVEGSIPGSGLVTVEVGTGCRSLGHQPAADPSAPPGANPLGVSGGWRVHTLPCGLRTVAVTGPAARPFSVLPTGGAMVATKDVYANRSGLAARVDAGTVTSTTTTGTC